MSLFLGPNFLPVNLTFFYDQPYIYRSNYAICSTRCGASGARYKLIAPENDNPSTTPLGMLVYFGANTINCLE